MEYTYRPRGVCSQQLSFDLDGDKVSNIQFVGGCNGNLKAISILCDGMSVDEIVSKLYGNTCGNKDTSCADQFARAVKKAYEESKN